MGGGGGGTGTNSGTDAKMGLKRSGGNTIKNRCQEYRNHMKVMGQKNKIL